MVYYLPNLCLRCANAIQYIGFEVAYWISPICVWGVVLKFHTLGSKWYIISLICVWGVVMQFNTLGSKWCTGSHQFVFEVWYWNSIHWVRSGILSSNLCLKCGTEIPYIGFEVVYWISLICVWGVVLKFPTLGSKFLQYLPNLILRCALKFFPLDSKWCTGSPLFEFEVWYWNFLHWVRSGVLDLPNMCLKCGIDLLYIGFEVLYRISLINFECAT